MKCCELLLCVSIIHEVFTSEGRHIQAKRSSVLHYWRNLKISERLLSLIVCFWLLMPRLLFSGCVPFIPFDSRKPLPPLSLSASPTTRQTSLNPAVRDKIFKWWYNGKGIAILTHSSDSILKVRTMTNTHTQRYFTANCIILNFSSCHSWQIAKVRVQYSPTDLWKSYKIWINSDNRSGRVTVNSLQVLESEPDTRLCGNLCSVHRLCER